MKGSRVFVLHCIEHTEVSTQPPAGTHTGSVELRHCMQSPDLRVRWQGLFQEAGVVCMERSGCSPFPVCWAKGIGKLKKKITQLIKREKKLAAM